MDDVTGRCACCDALRVRLLAAIADEHPAVFGSMEDPYYRGWYQMAGKATVIVAETP